MTTSKRSRLDRFLSAKLGINRGDVRLMLAKKQVLVDGIAATDIQQQVDSFTHVALVDQTGCEPFRVLQDNQPQYWMMNKPIGVVSATIDEQHKTVIDLLSVSDVSDLHIAGRLDLNSSGLLLLTNDGRWSRALSEPKAEVSKCYRVRLEKPLTEDYIQAFADGMYFSYEDITTRPVELRIVSDYVAQLRLVEGRYHQIKRMFGRFRNPVLALHRLSIGNILLDETLAPGQYRPLTDMEIRGII
ncbi:16S rRNA pseudouridine(516) synthase [Gammaproteobacteria bacterium 42_54_T18]|nr:16S rRNA pseudouridine(516) synthase [Gammaproteobacteria bacterium 42_54_T18]